MRPTRDQLEEGCMDVLSWQVVRRDDEVVARALWEDRRVKSIWAMDQTALLDDYFYYLGRLGVLDAVGKTHPWEGKRFLVPFCQLIMLYLAKQACGIESMNALPEVLFSNEGAMRLLGFNAYQIRNGVCQRGQWRRQDPDKYGPVCPEMLAANIAKMGHERVEELFNRSIRYIARTGILPKKLTVSLDATDILTTEKYEGCGRVARKKTEKDKRGKLQTIEVMVHGWKLWGVMECSLGIPLALRIAPIQTVDNTYTRSIIEQAEKNLGKWAKIENVVLDRGFIDGEDLWWIKERGFHFVIPAKSDMHVHGEARRLAERSDKENIFPANRIEKVKHGYGKKAWIEEIETSLVGIRGLTCYDAYGPEGEAKKGNRKNFEGKPINAVVVTLFDGKEPRSGKPCVLMTDLDVDDPFVVFDLYDQRSLIENGLWRSGKQYWNLSHAPRKTEGAVISHCYLTMMTMALTACFRSWADEQAEKLQSGKKLGIERYWRKLDAQNAARVIAFLDDAYGIFYLSEVFTLLEAEIIEPHPNARSLDQLKSKFNLS